MQHVMNLENRRMFAAATWDIGFSGGQQFSSMFPTIGEFVTAAGNEWAALVPGVGAQMQVTVNLASGANESTGRLSARSIDTTQVSGSVFDQSATAKLRYGDADRPGVDIEINIDPAYLTDSLWFDPDVSARTADVPAGKVDAYSAILHELGHAFFFNGFRNSDGSSTGSDLSVFDTFVTQGGAGFVFNGTDAVAAYGAAGGGGVPLTAGNMYHVGNAMGVGADLVGDLMNGFEFGVQTRYSISNLDKAVASDLIEAGTRPPDAPSSVAGTSAAGKVVVTWQDNSSTETGFRVLKDDGAGNFVTLGTVGAGVTTFDDGQVLAGVTYKYKVEAFDGDGRTAQSSSTSVAYIAPTPRSVVVKDKETMTYTAANGVSVAVSVKGPGTVTLNFATASGNADPVSVVIRETNVKTQISMTASSAFLLRGLNADVGVGRLVAPNANLTGLSELNGVGILQVNEITGGTLVVHGSVVNGAYTIGQVTDSAMTFEASLKSLSVLSFQGSGGTGGVLTVNAAKKLQAGAFNGTLTVTGSQKQVTLSNVTNSTLNLSGATLVSAVSLIGTTVKGGVPSVTAQVLQASTILGTSGIGNLKIAGTVTGTTIRTTGSIGTISAGTISATTIAAGVSATPVTFPTASPFGGSASIKSLKTTAFSNSLIVAPTVGKLTLGAVTTSNSGGTFGVYGNTVAGVAYVEVGVKKSVKGDVVSGDFRVEVA